MIRTGEAARTMHPPQPLRERRLAARIDAGDTEAARASDAHTLIVFFVAIPLGMLLTVVSAVLVYL